MKNKLMQSSLVLAFIALGFTLGSLLLSQSVMAAIANVIYGTSKYAETPTIFYMIAYTTATGMVLAGYYLFVTRIEKRTVSELDKTKALPELGLGLAIGAGIISLVVLILWGLGYYQVATTNPLEVLVRPLFGAILAGVAGEVIFRGILFRFIERSWGSRAALTFTALLFGFLHWQNPNATFFGGLAIAVGAGLLLGGAYMLTRRIWLVIGIHLAWNFVLGSVFGLPVSGNVSIGLLQAEVSGPILLTGGDFGPEASLITLLVGLAVGVVMIKKANQEGQFIKSTLFK